MCQCMFIPSTLTTPIPITVTADVSAITHDLIISIARIFISASSTVRQFAGPTTEAPCRPAAVTRHNTSCCHAAVSPRPRAARICHIVGRLYSAPHFNRKPQASSIRHGDLNSRESALNYDHSKTYIARLLISVHF